MKQLKINPEYSSLLTPLSSDEYTALKQSIKVNGQFLPIIVNENDEILDGHTRYQVCQELNLEPLTKKVSLDKNDEIDYVVSVNANRRHLVPITMVILASRKYGDGLGHFGDRNEFDIAAEFGCSNGQFHRAREVVLRYGAEKAILLMKKEKFSLPSEYELIMHEKKIAARRQSFQDADSTQSILTCEDFQTASIKENSIDAIITDPPYPSKFLKLFEELGILAKKWLKPRGHMLVMSGVQYLPEVFRLLSKSQLTYYWTIAYRMPGGTNLIHGRPVQSRWKPIIWYRKDVEDPRYHDDMPIQSDFVISERTEQEKFDEWQQSVSGMSKLVEWCTRPGDIVLDPMMGRGTTGVAAIRLKRKFIGIDNDPDAFKDAKGRIEETEKNIPTEEETETKQTKIDE